MEILVAYDVSTVTREGQKRLRTVAQVCSNYGQRVQKSLFECTVDEMLYERLKRRLVRIIEPEEDSLRIYRLQLPKAEHLESFGLQRVVDFQEPLVL